MDGAFYEGYVNAIIAFHDYCYNDFVDDDLKSLVEELHRSKEITDSQFDFLMSILND